MLPKYLQVLPAAKRIWDRQTPNLAVVVPVTGAVAAISAAVAVVVGVQVNLHSERLFTDDSSPDNETERNGMAGSQKN